MNIPSTYTSPTGKVYLELREINDLTVETLALYNHELVYLDKRDLITGGYKKKQLPPDMRQWEQKVVEAWVKHRFLKLRDFAKEHRNMGSSTKLHQVLDELRYSIERVSIISKDLIPQIQRRYPVFESKTTPQVSLHVPIKSRRVRQKIARSQYLDVRKKAIYIDKPPVKSVSYPEPPPKWPIPFIGSDLGEALALSNYRMNGLGFLGWFEKHGKYINASYEMYYRLWLDVEESLKLKHGKKFGALYLCRKMSKPFLEPWGWPYSGVGFIGHTKERTLAQTGTPRPKDKLEFLTWLDNSKKIPFCGVKNHSLNAVYSCRFCANLAYKDWWKGK